MKINLYAALASSLAASIASLALAGPPADAGAGGTHPAAHPAHAVSHRYLIERSFPAGALDGLDAATKAAVNATNARYGVRWIKSYANADKTKTYCIYEGPNEVAIRSAAAANSLPVDSVTEIPAKLLPK